MTYRIWAVILAVLLGLGVVWGRDDEYQKRREALGPSDHEGLFELGMWCLNRGGALDKGARECFEDLLGAPPEVRDRAAHRLALWHLARGRGFADQQLGVELLAELVRRGAQVPASKELDARRVTIAARKRELVEKAMRALVGGHLGTAARTLNDARRLPFGQNTGDPELASARIFDSLARAWADSETEAKRFADPKLPIKCPKCSGSGFEPCPVCKGKGTVTRKTPPTRVLTEDGLKYVPGKTVTVKCARCQGEKKIPCGKCRVTGLDFSALSDDLRKDFFRFGNWLKNLSGNKEPRRAVERAFEETVDTRLRVPASLEAKVSFQLIPPTREKMDLARLGQFWEQASEKQKHELIRGITVLSARWLEPFFFHSSSRKTLGVKEPFAQRARTVPLAPEILGADPVLYDNRWVSVAGEVKDKQGKGPWTDDMHWIDLKGEEGTHNLRFFVWKEKSREKHKILSELHKDFQYLKRFLWTYPFNLEEEISQLGNGSIVVMYGRFVHAPGRHPSQAVEVWAIDEAAERRKINPPRTTPADPASGETEAHKAALYHARALDLLRGAGTDEKARDEARPGVLEALRESIDFYQRAMAETPDDFVVQESHARTLRLLHAILAGGWWPR